MLLSKAGLESLPKLEDDFSPPILQIAQFFFRGRRREPGLRYLHAGFEYLWFYLTLESAGFRPRGRT